MTSRERVLKALAFEPTDRVPMDLGGMPSTSISCFAYPKLVEALGLPPRRPMVYDIGQMLGLPETDVLDALECDVVTVMGDVTNAFPQPELWHPYDFGNRLLALVQDPSMFDVMPDGTVILPRHQAKMPPTGFVFNSDHAGQPLVLDGDLPKPDLKQLKAELEGSRVTEEEAKKLVPFFRRIRESTDRAVMYCGPQAGIGIANFGGIATFPMLCLTEPDFVMELHDLVISAAIERVEALLAHIGPYVDVYQCCSDDWGTQDSTVASKEIFEELFQPYYRRFTDTIHKTSPNVKTFLHCCGAVYDILDNIVDCGFDVLNPVQWTAGGHSYGEWKDKARRRIALWGGGVNAQETLPLGTVNDVAREVAEIVPHMSQDSGFVFNGIHNILAEIPGEKVVAMYRAAKAAPCG